MCFLFWAIPVSEEEEGMGTMLFLGEKRATFPGNHLFLYCFKECLFYVGKDKRGGAIHDGL